MLTAARAWPTMARMPTTAFALPTLHRSGGWRLLARDGRTTLPLRLLLIRERAMRIDARVAATRAANRKAIEDGRTLHDDTTAAYWQQGDLSMADEASLRERMKLRSHPRIHAALGTWWAAARSMDVDGDDHIGREEHAFIFIRVYRALLDDYCDDDAAKAIAEDWESDSAGEPRLTQARFCDSLFEVADMWTSAIDVDEYVEFLTRLLEHIAPCVRGEDGGWRYYWKEVGDIELIGDGQEGGGGNGGGDDGSGGLGGRGGSDVGGGGVDGGSDGGGGGGEGDGGLSGAGTGGGGGGSLGAGEAPANRARKPKRRRLPPLRHRPDVVQAARYKDYETQLSEEMTHKREAVWRRRQAVARAKERRDAARRLQAGARGMFGRFLASRRRVCVVVIQARARGYMARKPETRQKARYLDYSAAPSDRREAVKASKQGTIEQRRIAAARTMQAGTRGWHGRKVARRRRLGVLLIQASVRGHHVRCLARYLRSVRRSMGGGVSLPGAVRYSDDVHRPYRLEAQQQLGSIWERLHARNTRQAADTMAKLLTPRTAHRLRTSSRVRPRPPIPNAPLLAPLKGPLRRAGTSMPSLLGRHQGPPPSSTLTGTLGVGERSSTSHFPSPSNQHRTPSRWQPSDHAFDAEAVATSILEGPRMSKSAAIAQYAQQLPSQPLPCQPLPSQPHIKPAGMQRQPPSAPPQPPSTRLASSHSWRVLARASTLYQPSASSGYIEMPHSSKYGAPPPTPALIARSLAASLGPRPPRSAKELPALAAARPSPALPLDLLPTLSASHSIPILQGGLLLQSAPLELESAIRLRQRSIRTRQGRLLCLAR